MSYVSFRYLRTPNSYKRKLWIQGYAYIASQVAPPPWSMKTESRSSHFSAVSIMSSPTRHFKMLSILGIQWYLFNVFISRCLMKTVFEHLLTCFSSFMNCLFISFAHFSKGCLFICFPTYICYTHSLLHKHKLQNFLLVFSLPFMLLGYLVLFFFLIFFEI